MPDVAIVTDSTACIPQPILEELNIHWLPYYIHRGEEVLRDMVKRKSRPQTWLQGRKGGMRSVPESGATKVVAGKNQQVVGSSPSAGSNIAAFLCVVFGGGVLSKSGLR